MKKDLEDSDSKESKDSFYSLSFFEKIWVILTSRVEFGMSSEDCFSIREEDD